MSWQVHETKVNMEFRHSDAQGRRFTMEIRCYGYETAAEAAVAAFESAKASCLNGRALDVHSSRLVNAGKTISAAERAYQGDKAHWTAKAHGADHPRYTPRRLGGTDVHRNRPECPEVPAPRSG